MKRKLVVELDDEVISMKYYDRDFKLKWEFIIYGKDLN